ncbi:hypothetical protein [Sulfurovum sp. NBC37-1]|uniref:hypothetical protein n=1 Tax=Sulfurovum sp. (strain NBC37-1) TaxID=387093 RepID=UPI0002D4F7F1|nr:hypothetical protein [Sulfurovum sp. NBC37-1]
MKHIYFSLITLLLITGCSPAVGFGIGGVAGGSNGGTEVIATQDGIHGQIVAGGDIVR